MPKEVLAKIRTLDAVLECTIHTNTTTHDLLVFVSKTVGVTEIALFGLQYKDRKGFLTWMRLNKKVLSHDLPKRSHSPLVLHYAVRYIPEDVEKEIKSQPSLQLLFLQVQGAILNEEVTCPEDKAVSLASFTCQAAMGDFSKDTPKLKGEKLLPKGMISRQDELVPKIVALWKRYQGMDRNTAMMNYLKSAQQLEMYGVNYFKVKNKKGGEMLLGVFAKGVFLSDTMDRHSESTINLNWSEVRKIDINGKKFVLTTRDKENSNSHPISFYGESRRKIKHIYGLSLGNHELYCRRRMRRDPKDFPDGCVIGKSVSEVMSWEPGQDTLTKPPSDGHRISLSDDEGEESFNLGSSTGVSERSDSPSSHGTEGSKTPIPGSENVSVFADEPENEENGPEDDPVDLKRIAMNGSAINHEVEVKKMRTELIESQQELKDYFNETKPEEEDWQKPVEGYLLMQVQKHEEEDVIPVQAVEVEESCPVSKDETDTDDVCRKQERLTDPDGILQKQLEHFHENVEPENEEHFEKSKQLSRGLNDSEGTFSAEEFFQFGEDKSSKQKGDVTAPFVEEMIEKEEKNITLESDVHGFFDQLDQDEQEHRERQQMTESDIEERIDTEEQEEQKQDGGEEEEDEEEEQGDVCRKRQYRFDIDKELDQEFKYFQENAGEPNVEQRSYELNQRADSPSAFHQLLSKAKKGFEDFFSFGSRSSTPENEDDSAKYTGSPVDESVEEETYVPNVESEREDYFDIIDRGEDPDLPSWKKEGGEEEEEEAIKVDEAPEVQAENTDEDYFDGLDKEEEMIFARMEANKRKPPNITEDIIREDQDVMDVHSANDELFNGAPNVQEEEDFDFDIPDKKTKGKDIHQEDFEKHRHNLEIMERMSNFESEVKKAMEAIERCEDIVKRVEELQRKTDEKMTVLTYL